MNPKIAGIIWGLAVVLVVGGLFYMSGGKTAEVPKASDSTSVEADKNVKVETETISAKDKIVKATIKTKKGNIELELYPNAAPKTVENFVKLSDEKFYDGTKFHRVIDDFMIQGGDPLSKIDSPRVGTGGPGYQFEDEMNPKTLGVPDDIIKQYEAAGYKYNYTLPSLPVDVGAIAMANSGPNTNGSQFFIVSTKAQPHLYGKHTVFGKVTSGMDIVRSITQGDVVESITITK